MTEAKRTVNYEEFGAIGDGIKDDFFAIKAAHDYANENNLSVVATPGKTYRIHDIKNESGEPEIISIKTDVVWTGVSFTIDDRGFTPKDKNNKAIFSVKSDYPVLKLEDRETIEKIFSGTKIKKDFTGKVNWEDFGYPAMLVLWNTSHKNYIRYGGDANNGSCQRELVVIDENGKIRESTPFMFDYDDITGIDVYRMDERHITVKGGKFTTIANDIPQTKENWGYYGRGFAVNRSSVKVDGLEHYVVGELPGTKATDPSVPKCPPYGGFLSVSFCTDVTLMNCILTGRRYSGIAGTYDFTASTANNLCLYNFSQSNYYKEDGVTPSMDYINYWGIGGTNFCKNLVYDSCTLSRFDAHCGLYHGKVVNSTICNFELIGAGDMLIENTTITPVRLPPIMLRGDYGCTWRGTLTVKDVTITYAEEKETDTLVSSGWVNHYFGYTCYMPNLIIDNVKWENLTSDKVTLCSFSSEEPVFADTLSNNVKNENVTIPPELVKITNNNGVSYTVKDVPLYREIKTLEGVEILPITK